MEGTEIGQYRLVRKIGEGTMGTVFEAIHLRLNRHVALKILKGEHLADDSVAARFVDEASITSGLRHPNIVEVLDAGTHQRTPFLVMELLEGESLAERLTRGPLDIATALEFTYQTTQAVEYAHRRGVIHRDLKPDNLYIVADPRIPGHSLIKVLDFSIAKLRGANAERSSSESGQHALSLSVTMPGSAMTLVPTSSGRHETRVGSVFGTPPYMSPEQCRGATSVDARTDVYALGIILYETLTGHVPFDSEDISRVLERHISEPPLDVRELAPAVPAEVAAIVNKALAKAPDERYQSMDQFGAALSALSFVPGLHVSGVPSDNVKWSRLTPTTLTGIGAPPLGVGVDTQTTSNPFRPKRAARLALGMVTGLCIAGLVYLGSNAASREDPTTEQYAALVQGAHTAPSPPSNDPATTVAALRPSETSTTVSPESSLTSRGTLSPSANTNAAPNLDAQGDRATSRPPRQASLRHTAVRGLAGTASNSGAAAPAGNTQVVGSTPSGTMLPRNPTPKADDIGSGTLTFDSAPWSNVYLNGRLLGATPLIGVRLPVGTHALELRSPETQRKTTYVVEIKADQNISRFVGWESE